MRFDIITIFPEFFDAFVKVGLFGKAVADGKVSIDFVSPRDFTSDKHRTVDDAPFGGGSGMVMMAPPIVDALESLAPTAAGGRPHRVLVTPQGAPFRQATARRFAGLEALAIVCGRYEGYDERIRAEVDEEVSLGDFVLLGGEVAAMAILEATARLLPGVLGNEDSPTEESHEQGLLEYPQYTRPREYRGEAVPDALLSGDHARIRKWRRERALERTLHRRPDMLEAAPLDQADEAFLRGLGWKGGR
ncbi:MAG: tRNA (guanosine(37)-N1)-methyltransferase TrmD [Polyangiales bacterium]